MVVVPDGGGEGEESLEHSDVDTLAAVSAVMLEAEFALQRVIDRLDDLADRAELSGAPRRGLVPFRVGRTSSTSCSARRASNSAEM